MITVCPVHIHTHTSTLYCCLFLCLTWNQFWPVLLVACLHFLISFCLRKVYKFVAAVLVLFFSSLLLLFLFSLFFSRSQQQQLPFLLLLLLLLLPAGTLVCPLSRGLANLIIICFALIIIMIIVAAALVCQIVCKGCCSFRKKKEKKKPKKKPLATKSRVCIVYVSHMFAFIAKSWHMAWPWSWKHTYASVYTGIDICIACIYMYIHVSVPFIYLPLWGEGRRTSRRARAAHFRGLGKLLLQYRVSVVLIRMFWG